MANQPDLPVKLDRANEHLNGLHDAVKSYSLASGQQDMQMGMKFKLAFGPGPAPGFPVMGLLREIYDKVWLALAKLERFLLNDSRGLIT